MTPSDMWNTAPDDMREVIIYFILAAAKKFQTESDNAHTVGLASVQQRMDDLIALSMSAAEILGWQPPDLMDGCSRVVNNNLWRNTMQKVEDTLGARVTSLEERTAVVERHLGIGGQPSVSEVMGVDLSRWQGDIDESTPELDVDWQRVVSAGYRFAIIKLTEGVGYNREYAQQLANGALAGGIALQYYHFGTPHYTSGADHVEDAKLEAQGFLDALTTVPPPTQLTFESGRAAHVWVDLEKDAPNLDRQEGLEWTLAKLETVEAAGISMGLYTRDSWLEDEVADFEVLYTRRDGTHRPIWVARFGQNTGGLPPQPKYDPREKVPDPWRSTGDGWPDVWQFTSKGWVPGIAEECDLNLARIVGI